MSYINPSVDFFSNPDISLCDNSPCGTSVDDNARSLNTDKDIISNFRDEIESSNDIRTSILLQIILQSGSEILDTKE